MGGPVRNEGIMGEYTRGMRLRIAELAMDTGWRMKDLAELLEVDYQTVLYWNQGRALPRLPTFIELCRLLGCSFQDMIEL